MPGFDPRGRVRRTPSPAVTRAGERISQSLIAVSTSTGEGPLAKSGRWRSLGVWLNRGGKANRQAAKVRRRQGWSASAAATKNGNARSGHPLAGRCTEGPRKNSCSAAAPKKPHPITCAGAPAQVVASTWRSEYEVTLISPRCSPKKLASEVRVEKLSRSLVCLVVFLVGCAAGGAASTLVGTAAAQPGPPGAPRWSYACFKNDRPASIQEQANRFGAEGWELASSALSGGADVSSPIWCFKRPY
jgi:hypothetical protein